ncbi:S8/S53 family peptidase [Solirubrobacter phytolaccae]|uniref:S8/S53 family peptidase n=1 Tax=Solirubrobacter phytolaccae TaxID=1404360 RepID=A0A9X3SC41_9ACTN|nr:S8/S53 family peptidase [Solirubrobacter phytolaccae]MDA0185388.1 S8/S53 family peptidase [Solirubrobacter phytolaccae]
MQRYRGPDDPSRLEPDPPGPVYEPDVLIVGDASVETVVQELAKIGIKATVDHKAPPLGPFKLLHLTEEGDTQVEDLVEAAMKDLIKPQEAERRRSLDDDPLIVQPNYIHGAPQMRGGVYAVPDPVTMPDLDIVPSPIGADVKVLVIDTEYNASPKIPAPGPVFPPPEDPPSSGNLAPAAGHCTFVIGQILRVAPGAEIMAPRVALNGSGIGTDTQLLTQLHQIMITGDVPHLLNLSLGYYTLFDDPPAAVSIALETLQNEGTVIVAAAGNEDDDRPWYPAADVDRTVSVGAVVRVNNAWARAAYSNYGDWVDFVARGLNEGPYLEWTQQPQPYGGWARWGGTSFSTPLVVGQLAALMSGLAISATDAVTTLQSLSAAAPSPDFPNAKVVSPTLLWGQSD